MGPWTRNGQQDGRRAMRAQDGEAVLPCHGCIPSVAFPLILMASILCLGVCLFSRLTSGGIFSSISFRRSLLARSRSRMAAAVQPDLQLLGPHRRAAWTRGLCGGIVCGRPCHKFPRRPLARAGQKGARARKLLCNSFSKAFRIHLWSKIMC
jgi:hypothetical protein